MKEPPRNFATLEVRAFKRRVAQGWRSSNYGPLDRQFCLFGALGENGQTANGLCLVILNTTRESLHARSFTVHMECDTGSAAAAVAEPVHQVAHGNLLWPEGGDDRAARDMADCVA